LTRNKVNIDGKEFIILNGELKELLLQNQKMVSTLTSLDKKVNEIYSKIAVMNNNNEHYEQEISRHREDIRTLYRNDETIRKDYDEKVSGLKSKLGAISGVISMAVSIIISLIT